MAACVIAVDIGSSSLKAAAIDEGGSVRAYSRQALLLRFTDHAASEWKGSLVKALEDIAVQLPNLKADALCVSGNGPTLVAGGSGTAAGAAGAVPGGETLLWDAPDGTDAADNTGGNGAKFGGPAIGGQPAPGAASADTPGGAAAPVKIPPVAASSPAAASLFIPRLQAFKRRYPAIWKESPRIYSGPEYLIKQLTGADLTILPESRYAAAYWTPGSLLAAGFSGEEAGKLPPFVSPGSRAGQLVQSLSPAAPEGTPVYCGAPDFISALVGTDSLSPGKLCDRAGSSEGLNICSSVPLEGEGIRTLPSIIPGLWNASYLLPESGSRFSAFKAKVERELGREIDFDSLVYLCINNPGREAVFEQGKYLMLQTAMQVRDGLKVLLAKAGEQGMRIPDRMVVTGGQAANDGWSQMKANVTGLAVQVPECSDAEPLGDAVLAFVGMGLFPSIEEGAARLCRAAKLFEPEAF